MRQPLRTHEIMSGHDVKSVWKMLLRNEAPQRTLPSLSRWHCLSIHYTCILSTLITLFVGLIAVLLKTGWAGGPFVLELMMSLCDRAGREGWGHWNRLRGAAVWVLVWLAAAVIRPLCLQQGPTELPWQGPMFPTPADSPDGPSDTEGEKEGGRQKASREIGRGSKKVKWGRRKWKEGKERIKNWGKGKIQRGKSYGESVEEWGSRPESLLTALLLLRQDGLSGLGSGLVCLPSICFLFLCSHPEACLSEESGWRRHSGGQHN